jgi:uncharacterized protein (TIGR02996 family)
VSVAKGARKPKAKPDPYPPGWEPFLAAIRAEVFDDTPRLVFADWLDENGDPERAELIRAQCRLQHLRPDDPAIQEVAARCEVLMRDHWVRWTAQFPTSLRATRQYFVRGFVTAFSLTGAQFVKYGAELARITAIDDLSITRSTVEALRSPALADVGGLHLAIADSERVTALAEYPNLSNLRYLFVSNGADNGLTYRPTVRLSREAVRTLLLNRTLNGLQRFALNGTRHGDEVAERIASGAYSRLADLSLYSSDLSADGLKALVNSASAPALADLHIAGNPIGDEGIRHMVEAQALTRVACLNVMECGLTINSVRLLAEWPGLRTVRWLQLGHNGLSNDQVEPIRKSRYAVALNEVGVY